MSNNHCPLYLKKSEIIWQNNRYIHLTKVLLHVKAALFLSPQRQSLLKFLFLILSTKQQIIFLACLSGIKSRHKFVVCCALSRKKQVSHCTAFPFLLFTFSTIQFSQLKLPFRIWEKFCYFKAIIKIWNAFTLTRLWNVQGKECPQWTGLVRMLVVLSLLVASRPTLERASALPCYPAPGCWWRVRLLHHPVQHGLFLGSSHSSHFLSSPHFWIPPSPPFFFFSYLSGQTGGFPGFLRKVSATICSTAFQLGNMRVSLTLVRDCGGTQPLRRMFTSSLGSDFNSSEIPRQGLIALCRGSFRGNRNCKRIPENNENQSFISAVMDYQVSSFASNPSYPLLSLSLLPGDSLAQNDEAM